MGGVDDGSGGGFEGGAYAEGLRHFELWLHSRSSPELLRSQRLSEASARPYRTIWCAWLRHLGSLSPPVHWREARAVHVRGFLEQAQPTRAARVVSHVTHRRYWRVLERLYDYATFTGHACPNPARQIGRQERPEREAKADSAALDPALWGALLRSLEQDVPASEPFALRDRAILALVMHAALTPGELRRLTLRQVTLGEKLGENTLRLAGRRKSQQRTLVLPESAAVHLRAWLGQRAQHSSAARTDLVFVSERGALSEPRLFGIVRAAIARAASDLMRSEPAHLGSTIVRNTALLQMLQSGHSGEEVAAFAGLKGSRSLLRLLRLTPRAPRM